MRVRWFGVMLGVVLARAHGAAQDEVVIEASPLGVLRFHFPDGATADWFPSVMGAEWAYTNWRDAFMVDGSGHDLFSVGQRTRLPVRNADNGVLDLFAQFTVVEDAPEVLHFTYQFSAPEDVRLNTAYIECTLPAASFAEAALETIGGPPCPPVLPAQPMGEESHLANGTGSGLATADGTAHAVGVQLDQPKWCVALDARVWQQPWYALQFCALAAADGTLLAKDTTADVSGDLTFACPVRVAEPAVATPAAPLAGQKLHWSATDPEGLCLRNAAGERVAWFDPVVASPAGEPPQLKEQTLAGPEGEGSRLEAQWTARGDGKLSPAQTALVRDNVLTIEAELTAPEDYDGPPVIRYFSLPASHFAGCKLTFVGETEPWLILLPELLDRGLGRAMARGVRVSQGDTQILQLEADAPRCWTEYTVDGSFGVAECLLGNPIARHAYGGSGNHYLGRLTARAGDR